MALDDRQGGRFDATPEDEYAFLYAAENDATDFRTFLCEGTIPERKALIRNFVKGIEVTGSEATLTYTVPMPSDGLTGEEAPVLDFVQSGLPSYIKSRTFALRLELTL